MDTVDWTVLGALATVLWTWLTSVWAGPGAGLGAGLEGAEDEVDDSVTEVPPAPDAELVAAPADPDFGAALDPGVDGDEL